jgi:type VI secretion system secreted protein VgrG
MLTLVRDGAMRENVLVFSSESDLFGHGELVLTLARGHEHLSALYEFELTLEVHREGGLAHDAVRALLARPCSIHQADEAGSAEVHGMLAELRMVAAVEGSPVTYRAVLVPRLWKTTRQLNSRVFQDVTVAELVDRVLEFSGLRAEWRLSRDYPRLEYVVQFEESDFAFVSRQLEHWGIWYYFRQEPDGEILVIGDHNRGFEPIPDRDTLSFSPRLGRSGVRGCVHHLGSIHRLPEAVVTVRDYNYLTPSGAIETKRDVEPGGAPGFGLRRYYGDHFRDEDEAKVIAQVRAEQLLNRCELYEGICSVPGLAPGHTFELLECPIPELNITYLVTSVAPSLGVTGDHGDEAYEYRFTAVPLERDEPAPVTFRPQRVTARPRITGFMHGVIDGEVPGTAAPIDEQGRYKVVLPLDSGTWPKAKASRWIRMIQPSSGAGYGIHFPLHIGTEVAIIHLDGDPDRPVILGAVPNPATTSPVVQANATQSRIKTSTGIVFELDDDVGPA